MKNVWRRSLVSLFLGVVVLGYGGLADAATWKVCKEVWCEYNTIQSAIEAPSTVNGDTVLVSGGMYVERINFDGKAIAVQSVNGAAHTIIDGDASGSVVVFENNELPLSVLAGFTVQNGSAPEGGGIYCTASSSPTIKDCIITSNSSTVGNAGGLYCGNNSSPTISNCLITSNTAADSGGGIYCDLSSPTITGCVIRNNIASEKGGGIVCNSSSPTIINCTISKNKANLSVNGSGGGIFCNNSASPEITDCTITSNIANTDANGAGGGIACENNSSPSINNCLITDNMAVGGGGIYCLLSSPKITNCTISDNTATWGGGIRLAGSSPKITNCIISDNTANGGGGIYCFNTSSPKITNCTISGNMANANGGGGIYCYYGSSSPVVVNSILWGDSPDEIYLHEVGGDITITYSDVEGGDPGNPGSPYPGMGNIDADPKFVVGDNYHLADVSPCIDRGTSNKAVYPTLPDDDIDGDPRPWDVLSIPNNPSAYDMGADEYISSCPPPEVSTYNSATKILHIPTVQVGPGKCYIIDLKKEAKGWKFSLINATAKPCE